MFNSIFLTLITNSRFLNHYWVIWVPASFQVPASFWVPDPTIRHSIWSTLIGVSFMWMMLMSSTQSITQRILCVNTPKRAISTVRNIAHWKIGHAYPSVPSVWSLWEQWFTFLYIEATSFDCQKVQWKQKTLTPLQLLLPLSCLCCSSAAFWSRFLREKIDERCDDGFP